MAAPATASAKSTSKVSPAASVQVNVDKASKAVKRMKRYARLGNSSAVARQLKIARSQSAAASRTARRMARTAVTEQQNVTAAKALTLAGTQYDELVETITAVVDQITGQVQSLVATAIAPSLAGKQQIIAVLTDLVDEVPASVQPIIASIIAGLSVGDANEIVNLDEALDSGTLPAGIAGIVTSALGMATGIIDQAFAMVQNLVPMMPVAAQAPMSQVLSVVNASIGTFVPSVLQTVTGLVDTILGSLPFVGGTSATSGGSGLSGLGGLLDGIVGGGAQSLPGNFGGMLDNLLGGLFGGGSAGTGSTPAAGGVGGILSNVTGMIGNLLGGLFGGQAAPAT
ncbi:MAG: hypothetical protein ACRDLN_10580 [Solirubrobacteraceae bacterium]